MAGSAASVGVGSALSGLVMPVAQLERVTQRYGKVVALDDVTVVLPAGTMVGLIGADGVGKSTLLSIIAGARRVQSGAVSVLDGDITNAAHRAAICSRIAYMPQGLGKNLYPDLSIRENIEFFGRVFGQSRSERNWRIGGAFGQHRPCAVCRPADEEIIGWNAAETRFVLLADPRSGPFDTRRADNRR